ncbi:hypothetical protein [Stenomitos frigidus]|uniref:hypothetical protein n=1 Tax=Stenomitos frigidus TaxID=1886765 RepID=UPI001C635DD9|nr:hypothetical protein [Stenomitos frigidus]
MEPYCEALPTKTPPRRLCVLIVEDNYMLAATLQEELECLGYDVPEIAASVEEAVRKAVSLRPQIVPDGHSA